MNLDDIQKVIESAVTKAVIEELKTFIGQSVTTAVGLQIAQLKQALDSDIKVNVAGSLTALIDDPGFGAKLTTSLEDSLRNNSIVWNNIKIPHEAVNFKTFKLSADSLHGGMIKEFSSKGIEDQAKDIQLTIFDRGIVVENKTLTRQLEVTDTAVMNKSLIVGGALAVKGELQLADSVLNGFSQQILKKVIDQLSQPTSTHRLPSSIIDFSSYPVPGGRIEGIIKKFTSSGIADHATAPQLAISNEGILVSGQMKSTTLETLGNALINGSLQIDGSVAIAGDLIVDGTVSLTDKSFIELANQAAANVKQNLDVNLPATVKIEIEKQLSAKTFDLGAVTVAGAPLLQGRKLANTIIDTNIQQLGELRELVVLGGASIGKVLSVATTKRVGINTTDPAYAFDFWDQEVEVAMYKLGSKNAYIGTPRDQTLSLGTNNKVAMSITPDGAVTINQLKVGRNTIAFAASVPNYAGANGDVVFSTTAKPYTPAGWICSGGTKWCQFSMITE